MHSTSRRLDRLESAVVPTIRATLPGLVQLCTDGSLTIAQLTDTELWWLFSGKQESFPGWDVFEQAWRETP